MNVRMITEEVRRLHFQAEVLLSERHFWDERGVFNVEFMQEVEAFNAAAYFETVGL
jgi:hypothetical protein